jgi:hypothetical protein
MQWGRVNAPNRRAGGSGGHYILGLAILHSLPSGLTANSTNTIVHRFSNTCRFGSMERIIAQWDGPVLTSLQSQYYFEID